jgi:hypothetical protein
VVGGGLGVRVLQSAPRQSASHEVQYLAVGSPEHPMQCGAASQSVRATEQLGPVHPAEHTQRGGSRPTSTHLP